MKRGCEVNKWDKKRQDKLNKKRRQDKKTRNKTGREDIRQHKTWTQ